MAGRASAITRALALVVVSAVAATGGCVANMLYIPPDTADSRDFAVTEDGWEIALYHYPPKGTPKEKPPLVLCHGMALNNFFWHITKKNNLPQWLADRGYDVWCCDLRGNGESRYRKRYNRFQGINTGMRKRGRGEYWTVDDYANFDVPAIIDAVREKTGSDKVTWIGHSMGGMVLYAYLINHSDDEKVANFVALGSPIMMPQPANDILRKMVADADVVNAALDAKVMKIVLRNFAILSTLAPTDLDILYYRRDNVTATSVIALWAYACENIQRGVSDQLMEMVKTGRFWEEGKIPYNAAEADGKEPADYTSQLSRIKIPILLLCAKADNMAPEIAVQLAYHGVGSEDRTYRLFALSNKYSADYGHCDLVTGVNARREVYPVIFEWLEKH